MLLIHGVPTSKGQDKKDQAADAQLAEENEKRDQMGETAANMIGGAGGDGGMDGGMDGMAKAADGISGDKDGVSNVADGISRGTDGKSGISEGTEIMNPTDVQSTTDTLSIVDGDDVSSLATDLSDSNSTNAVNEGENYVTDIDTQISDIDQQMETNSIKKANLENRRKQVADGIKECRQNGDYESQAQLSSESASLTKDISDIDKENEELQKRKDSLLKEKEENSKLQDRTMNVAQLNVVAGNVKLEGKEDNADNGNGQPIKTISNDAENDDNSAENDDSGNDDNDNSTKNNDDDIILVDGEESIKDKILKSISMARDTGFVDNVKDSGYDLYRGINSIRDTFYAPSATSSKDWETTASLRDERSKESAERRKERIEKVENKFVKNEGNKQFMLDNMKIKGMSVMEYVRDKNKNRKDISEIDMMEEAEKLVENELEKMKGYAKYGYDAQQAYPLYKDQKEYGFTQEEAIRNQAGFERFNVDVSNVSFVNETYGDKGIQVTNISQLAPNAREYYSNGYKDIRDIINLNYLEEQLNVTCKKAMQIDSVLRKQGKIECTPKKSNESDKEYNNRVRMYEMINNMYQKNI